MNSRWLKFSSRTAAMLCVTMICFFSELQGQYLRHPLPGDVFRDHRLANAGNTWRVTHPEARQLRAIQTLPNEVYGIQVSDLEGATRAELIVDYWGGHPGTDLREIRFNENDWLELPDLVTGSPNPNCYLQMVNLALDVPLSHLVEGINTMEGMAGPQLCYDFGWGMWGMYGVVLRIYYDPEIKPHPTGGITQPSQGGTITDDPLLIVSASSNVGVKKVDFLAYFNGYDPDGDGRFADWQLSYSQGAALQNHVGTDSTYPYRKRWNTNLVPDQPVGSVKLKAYITDNDGYTFVSEEVTGLTLKREDLSIRLYRSSGIKENLLVRDHDTEEMYFTIPQNDDLSKVEASTLLVRTWNALDPKTTTRVNSWVSPIYGKDHRPDFDRLGMGDGSSLVNGLNVFSMTNVEEEEHGTEIFWPGPALIVRYKTNPREPTIFPALYGFDEDSGDKVVDLTNNGNDGVIFTNASRNSNGRFGGGISFNGFSGHVDLGVIDFPGNELTVSMWAYIDSQIEDPNARLFAKAIGTRATEGQLIISLNNTNGIRYRLATTTGFTDLITYGSLTLDAWNHVAVTYDGSSMRVFINGIQRKATYKTGAIDNGSNVPIWLGDNPGGERRALQGRIDEVRIYSLAQTATQIVADMNTAVIDSDLTPPSIPSNLAAILDSKTSGTLAWEESSDDVNVSGYRIYRDGIQIGFSSGNTYTEYELFPNRTHNYTVTALDVQGNESAHSNIASISTPPDLQSPTTPLGLKAEPSAFSVNLNWSASRDDTGISHYRVFRNGVEVAPSAATNFSDSGLKVETTYVYQVMAVDYIGNFSGLSNRVLATTLSEPPNPTLLLGLPFEEETGAFTFDSSGYRYDGTLTNGVKRAAEGRIGRALQFSGNGGNVDVGALDLPGSEVTMAAWIRADDFGVKDGRIISKATGAADNQHYWMLSTVGSPEGIKFRARLKTSTGRTNTVIGTTTISEDVWTHVAFTYDGFLMRIYVNGVLDGELSHSGEIARNPRVPVAIGDQPQGGRNFDGLIDEFRIHTLVMSEEEIQKMMGERLPGPGGANLPPTVSSIKDQVVFGDADTGPISFKIADESTPADLLTVGVNSGNTSVIPFTGIKIGGTGANRTVTVTPAQGKTGPALISIIVSDGEATHTETFTVQVVTPGNTPPTVTQIDDMNIVAGGESPDIKLVIGDGETDVNQLVFNVTSNNQDLVSSSGISVTGVGGSRTIKIKPGEDETGIATITVNVSDGEFNISEKFVVTVNPPITESLLLGMPFEEGFGNSVFDVSEHEHDGSLSSGVSRSEEGKIGRALKFNAAGGLVDLGNLNVPGSAMTMTAWIKATDFGVPDGRIISKAAGGDENQHFWMLSTIEENGSTKLRMRIKAGSSETKTLIGNSKLSVGEWIHVAGTFNGSEMKLYINGVLDGTERASGSISQNDSVPVSIGNQPQGGRNFSGLIDEVHIYTQALSDVDIQGVMSLALDPPNATPFISEIDDQNIFVSENTNGLTFVVGDAETAPYLLEISATSSNLDLVPLSAIKVVGTGNSRTLNITPSPGRTGNAEITLKVDDGESFIEESFKLFVVTPGNAAPSISAIGDLKITPDSETGPIPFTVTDALTNPDLLLLSTESTNPELVSEDGIVISGSGTQRTVRITPNSGKSGSSLITITLDDGEFAVQESFTLSVVSPVHPDLWLGLPFEEESGNSVFDISSYRHDGAITFGVSRAKTAEQGGTLVFSGRGGNVSLGNLDIPGSKFTIAAWIRPDDFGIEDARIISKATGLTDNQHYWMLSTVEGVDGTHIRARLRSSDGDYTTLVGNELLTAGVWTHVAATYNGERLSLYVNGLLDGSMPWSGSIAQNSSVPVAIGDQPQGAKSFDGLIDDVQIYRKALTEKEIQVIKSGLLEVPNAAPSISSIEDMTAVVNTSTVPEDFRIDDVQTSPYLLNLRATSSNVQLIPPSGIIIGGQGNERTIALVPAHDETGSSIITLTIDDGEFTVEESFVINVVTPGNTPPTVSAIDDLKIIPDVSTGPMPFTINDTETNADLLIVSATSSNTKVVPQSGISLGGSGANRFVNVTPARDTIGTARIDVIASDGELEYKESFVVSVVPAIHPNLVLDLQFDEGSGTKIVDSSLNGFDGSMTSGVTRTSEGHTGGSVVFSGVGGQVDVGNLDIPGKELTIAAWIRADDFGVSDARIISKASGSRDNDHFWMLSTVDGSNGTKLRIRLKTTGGDTQTLIGSRSLSTGVWTHVAGTYDGSMIRLYVNGILDASMPWSGSIVQDPSVPVAVGNHPEGGNNFDGRIDELHLYSEAFEQSDIQAIMVQLLDVPNTGPSITEIADHYVYMNRGTGPLSFSISDVESTGFLLDVKANSDNPSLVPASGIVLSGSGLKRNIAITPTSGLSGIATITITVTDGGGLKAEESFLLRVVTPGNAPPSVSFINNQIINFGSATGPLQFTVNDTATSPGAITVTATSSNTVMLPPTGIVLGGSGEKRTISITPSTIQSGTAKVTLTVGDGELFTDSSFNITVNPPFDTSLWLGMPFEEVSGSSVYDLSPNGHNGGIKGEVARSYFGKYGRALEFSGNGGHIDLYNLDIPGAEMTIAAWIKPDDFGIQDARLISKANSSALNDHYWMLSTITVKGESKLRMRLKTSGSNTSSLVGNTTLIANEWTHVATTFNGAELRLYVNGELDGTLPLFGTIIQNAGVPVVIGDQPQGGRNFDGLIDDLQIYAQALDQANIQSIMAQPLVDVGPVNIPPTITKVEDQTIYEGHETAEIPFTIGDTETAATDLVVTAKSSNPQLVPVSGIVIGGSGSSREVMLTPIAGKSGLATITLSVSDGTDSVDETFDLRVKKAIGSAGWWNPNWEYRTSVDVSTAGVARLDSYVDIPINFSTLVTSIGSTDPIDKNTLRVVEVDALGNFLDDKTPFQFDPDPDFAAATKASGTLVIKLVGSTPVTSTRHYQIYFTPTGGGAFPAQIANEVTLTDGVIDEGKSTYRIATPNGVLYYSKRGAGFSSWVDNDGNDWINYHSSGGAKGSYRGIPQMAFADNKFHPDFDTATSTLQSAGPLKITIYSKTENGSADCKWEIYGNAARLTMLSADRNYWFLYEGTPGGTFDKNTDFLVRSDGVLNLLSERWSEDIPGDDWVYIADPDVGRSVFFTVDEPDNYVDTYAPIEDAMTVFGFGRNFLKVDTYLRGTPRSFTMGLVGQTTFGPMSTAVKSAYLPYELEISRTQRQSESNNSPNVVISSPVSQTWVTKADLVQFVGTANDIEDGNLTNSLVWSSSIDGRIAGSGSTVSTSSLSIGTHEITASVVDSGALKGSKTIVLEVRPNAKPEISISWPNKDAFIMQSESGLLSGTASDAEDGDLSSKLKWRSSINGALPGTGGLIPVSNLSVGSHTITATATDSGGLSNAVSAPLVVAASSSRPVVSIVSPGDESFFTQGDTINFTGTASDSEDGNLTSSIKWKSDIDGPISGTGGSISVSDLTAGIHTITATAVDSGYFPGSSSIIVTVGLVSARPVVTITSPSNGSFYTEGANIGFRAIASDVEDGTLTGVLTWSSSIDGPIPSTGGAAFISTLSVGVHTIRATAIDSGYLSGSASIEITIAAKTTPAAVTITAPTYGKFYSSGQSVNFSATAIDAEDGNITSGITWYSSKDGPISGSGGSVTAPSLSTGVHTITAKVVDSGLLPSSTSIEVYIGFNSSAPSVTVFGPEDGASFDRGNKINFVATATDSENGDLTSRISWRSNIDGPVGDIGGTVTISSLSVGIHTITATAVDSGFVPGFDSVKVIVRAVSFPPTVIISAPVDGSFISQGSNLNLRATASDIEDGDLSSKIVWNSSSDGEIGKGSSINTNSLSVGVHTISAAATDSGYLPGVDSAKLTVRAVSTPPVVSIVAPSDGNFFAQGDLMTFKATATDAEDGNVTGTITWYSDLDGIIHGNGGTVLTTALSVGIHRITATAIDSGFVPGVASINVAVSSESNAPVVVITGPSSGSFANQGDIITFTGTAGDADDGEITSVLRWHSDIDGDIAGTGGVVSTASLSPGLHTITASAIDSGFLPGYDDIEFTVRGVSTPPAVVITGPSDSSTFSNGEMIRFTASALDAEDGNISSSVVWSSNIDGIIGTGGDLSTPALSVGEHTITATAQDSGLLPSSSTITLTIIPLIGQLVSDDFTSEALDTELWTIEDPVGDGVVAMNGGALTITLPEGSDHDVWTSGNRSTRIMQDIFDTDFELQVRFTSPMPSQYLMQGFLIEQDPENFLRFDFVRFPSAVKAYSASFVGTVPTAHIDEKIPFGDNYYIRVKRTGDLWTMHYSLDGEEWILAGRYTYPLKVTKAGLYAGNASGARSPGFTLVADYVFNTAVPVYHQDSQVEVISSGEGTVTIDEERDYYSANQEITLTATAPEGWAFDGWSGDIVETANPLKLKVTDDLEIYALFFPTDGRPIIDVWYGDEQKFGVWGNPQGQINILGNVIISEQVESISFSLNGGPEEFLSMGPADNIRLARPGDFNVEIPYTDLAEGDNLVTISAVAFDGTVFTRDVVVESSIYNVWPRPYAIDWSQVSRIDDVAQVVDGKWELVPGGVKAVESHFDRLIALGDIEWTDFEVTVPITVHNIDFQPPPNEPLVGIMLRWDGHEKTFDEEQPGIEWRPIGAMGVHGWYTEGARGGHHFQVFETGSDKFGGYRGDSLPLETTYYFKFRVETQSNEPGGLYSLRVWPAGQPEPVTWGVIRQAQGGLVEGSVQLVAHYVEATFGNVVVTSLEDNEAPTVTIIAPAANSNFVEGAPVTFKAVASDVDDGDLTGEIFWSSNVDGPIEGIGGEISTRDLSLGDHVITAAVVDSDSSPDIDTVRITIGVNTPPTVSIQTPSDGFSQLSGFPSTFSAVADDIDEGDITSSIVWSSDRDGPIAGTGGTIFAPVFSLGTHIITATATDSGALNGSDTISIQVTANSNNKPSVDLTSPGNGSNFKEGDSVRFTAGASDVEDGVLNGSILWSSDLDGPIAGQGASISTSKLSVGTHEITASATDAGYFTGRDSVSITIDPNIPPVVSITTPSVETTLSLGETVSFAAFAIDTEEGDLTSQIIWSSSIDGKLSGVGAAFTTDDLTVGRHIVRASVTDSVGATTSDAIVINVNTPTGPIISDDFPGTVINKDLWTFGNPVGDCTFAVREGIVEFKIPEGTDHDLWTGGNKSARLFQRVHNTDFGMQAKFLSTPTAQFQYNGLLVEQDELNFIRYDIMYNGNSLRLFGANFANGNPTSLFNIRLEVSSAYFLQIIRKGDEFVMNYSYDAEAWETAGTLKRSMAVNKVDVHAGNASGASSPAYTALVDYFFNVDSPIIPEDEGTINTPPNLTITKPADGAVFKLGQDIQFVGSAIDAENGNISSAISWRSNLDGSLLSKGRTFNTAGLSVGTHEITARVVDTEETIGTDTVTIVVNEFGPLVSDVFNSGALNTRLWEFVDPRGDSNYTVDGDAVSINLLKGSDHDIWGDGNKTARIVQRIDNGNFAMEVKLKSAATERFQTQGILIEQDPDNFIRFDYYTSGVSVFVFAASFVDGVPTALFNKSIGVYQNYYLRAIREGNTFTTFYSFDGTNWLFGGSFVRNFDVNYLGVHAGNASGIDSPAFSAVVDYIWNMDTTNPPDN